MSTGLAVRAPDLDRLARMGQWLAASESGSNDPNALGAAAALRLAYAEALDLPIFAATEMYLMKGKVVPSAKLLRAIVRKQGYRVIREPDSNDKTCAATLIHVETGEVIGSTTFTMEDAKTAKLVRPGSAWETHPKRMLWARASKYVVDDYAPELALGLMIQDEIDEIIGEVISDELGGDPGAERVAAGMGPPSPPNPPDPGGAEELVPEEAASGDEHRPDNKPSTAQLRKLDATVGQMRRDQQITIAEVFDLACIPPTLGTDPNGELHWSTLRMLLNADEASKLISELGYWAYKHPPVDNAEHGAQASFEIPEKAKAKR